MKCDKIISWNFFHGRGAKDLSNIIQTSVAENTQPRPSKDAKCAAFLTDEGIYTIKNFCRKNFWQNSMADSTIKAQNIAFKRLDVESGPFIFDFNFQEVSTICVEPRRAKAGKIEWERYSKMELSIG